MESGFPVYGDETADADKRASDHARERVRQRLAQARDSGELTVAEYEQRAAAVDGALTYGSLGELTHDLADGKELAVPTREDLMPMPSSDQTPGWLQKSPPITVPWITTSLILSTIWGISCVASGELIWFWPIWPLGIMAAIFVAQMVTGQRGPSKKPDEGPGRDD